MQQSKTIKILLASSITELMDEWAKLSNNPAFSGTWFHLYNADLAACQSVRQHEILTDRHLRNRMRCFEPLGFCLFLKGYLFRQVLGN